VAGVTFSDFDSGTFQTFFKLGQEIFQIPTPVQTLATVDPTEIYQCFFA